MSDTPAPPRPRVVEAAFWVYLGGAVILMISGLMSATVSFDDARSAFDAAVTDEQLRQYLTIYRGSGIGAVLAGGALAFVAGRARRGDARFRRATIALALAIVVVVGMLAIGPRVAQPFTLLALLPILIATVLIVQPSARAWYAAKEQA